MRDPVGIAFAAVGSRSVFAGALALQVQRQPRDVAAIGGNDLGLPWRAGLAHGGPIGIKEYRVRSQQAEQPASCRVSGLGLEQHARHGQQGVWQADLGILGLGSFGVEFGLIAKFAFQDQVPILLVFCSHAMEPGQTPVGLMRFGEQKQVFGNHLKIAFFTDAQAQLVADMSRPSRAVVLKRLARTLIAAFKHAAQHFALNVVGQARLDRQRKVVAPACKHQLAQATSARRKIGPSLQKGDRHVVRAQQLAQQHG